MTPPPQQQQSRNRLRNTQNPDAFARVAAHTQLDRTSLAPRGPPHAVGWVFETTHTTLGEINQGHLGEKKNLRVFLQHWQPVEALCDISPPSSLSSLFTEKYKPGLE